MLKNYLHNTSGNFGIMFSVTMTVLLLGVGVAVDTAGLTKSRANMQSLADIGALAAASSGLKQPPKIKLAAKDAVNINNLNGYNLTTKVTLKNERIQVNVSTQHKTLLMGIFGKKSIQVGATAETPQKRGNSINVSLVLDTTDSMRGDKLDAMQEAVGDLLTSFKTVGNGLKVSVVPFSNYVNVGIDNRDAQWMDVDLDSSSTVTPECEIRQDSVCTGGFETVTEERFRDGVAYETTFDRCIARANVGEPYNFCPPPFIEDVTWSGCAGSRDGNRHKEPSYNGRAIPGIMNERCGTDVLPLTTNINIVEDKIEDLRTRGETYLPSGLIWGWRMLDSNEPFADVSNSETGRQRTMILMTDGKNTLSLNQPKHDGIDEVAANTLSSELCDLIKADNIQIYAVAYKFGGGDEGAKSVLRQCASSASNFFDANNQTELKNAFENIGKALFTVRLTR